MMILFVFPYKHLYGKLMYINITFTIANICFLLAAFKNPGYVKSIENIKFEKLVEKFDP